MSFPFQRSETKKDEEETLPAKEGDPLLPKNIGISREGGSGQPDSTSSSVVFNNSQYTTNTLRSRSGRTSRSPPNSTTTLLESASESQPGSRQKNKHHQIQLENSQMINAEDDPSTTSTAILDAATAAVVARSGSSNNNNNSFNQAGEEAGHYVDFLNDQESVGSNRILPTQSLSSSTQQQQQQQEEDHHHNTPHLTYHHNHEEDHSPEDHHHQRQQQAQQQHYNSHSRPYNTAAPPPPHYEPPMYRPPSPSRSYDARSVESGSQSQPPLLEIPEEIYAVRKAALKVLKPLTKTWIVISVGFSLTVLFGAARWTQLLPTVPFWFILMPCWSAHVGLLWLHVLSAKALSRFIAEANDSRQRPDSRDHLNRTEYLPLLQRSLKFGLKTGILSFFVFVFEILIFIRLSRGTFTLTASFMPLWLLVAGGIFDGLVCKTQHVLRVFSWILAFTAMLLVVLKVDYGYDEIRWRIIVCPVVAVLSIASGSLVYIVYGHQIGYYRLTEAQLTAGNLYALAALICIILVVMIGEVIPLSRPVEVETKLFVVVLSPLVICLTGMGAWVVSRDEFSRLLLYGGQSAVHPKRLRWAPSEGWACVQGKGVSVIPMFGEVSYQPLERKHTMTSTALELCACCSGKGCCYPYEEADEEEATAPSSYHPYLDSTLSGTRGSRNSNSYNTLRGL